MATITRYMTVVLGLIPAIGLTVGLFKNAVVDKSAFASITIIMVLTAGTVFLMWLGEQINEYGIGNGISLIIFAGIVDRFPTFVRNTYAQVSGGCQISGVAVLTLLIVSVMLVMVIILFEQGVRKIPVQYAKRSCGT